MVLLNADLLLVLCAEMHAREDKLHACISCGEAVLMSAREQFLKNGTRDAFRFNETYESCSLSLAMMAH